MNRPDAALIQWKNYELERLGIARVRIENMLDASPPDIKDAYERLHGLVLEAITRERGELDRILATSKRTPIGGVVRLTAEAIEEGDELRKNLDLDAAKAEWAHQQEVARAASGVEANRPASKQDHEQAMKDAATLVGYARGARDKIGAVGNPDTQRMRATFDLYARNYRTSAVHTSDRIHRKAFIDSLLKPGVDLIAALKDEENRLCDVYPTKLVPPVKLPEDRQKTPEDIMVDGIIKRATKPDVVLRADATLAIDQLAADIREAKDVTFEVHREVDLKSDTSIVRIRIGYTR